MKEVKTVEFTATIGIVAGYGGEQILIEAAKVDSKAMAIAWQEAAAQVMAKTGVYVSATINSSAALYHTDWGCPIGGEPTYTVCGSLNPQFGEEKAWKEAVLQVVELVKQRFNQSTVTVNFREVTQVYLA